MEESKLDYMIWQAYSAARSAEKESLHELSTCEAKECMDLITQTMTSLNNLKTNILNALHQAENTVEAQPKAAQTECY